MLLFEKSPWKSRLPVGSRPLPSLVSGSSWWTMESWWFLMWKVLRRFGRVRLQWPSGLEWRGRQVVEASLHMLSQSSWTQVVRHYHHDHCSSSSFLWITFLQIVLFLKPIVLVWLVFLVCASTLWLWSMLSIRSVLIAKLIVLRSGEGKTYNFRQKVFDKWNHQQWKMFDSQWWKIFDTKIFARKFSTQFFPVENIPPLIMWNSKIFHHTVENIPMTKIPKEYFDIQNKLQQYHKECWNNFNMKKSRHRVLCLK